MPDVSNEDLMKLIQNVIKKVDVIEQKLDLLLEEREKASNCLESNYANESVSFHYCPIKNATELKLVSKKINEDEVYKKKLVSHSLENFVLSTSLIFFHLP